LVSSKRLTKSETGDLTALYEAIATHLRNDHPNSKFEPQGSFVSDAFITTNIQETAPMCAPVMWKIENIQETITPDKYKYLITLKGSFQ
jgi:hypothetical protein